MKLGTRVAILFSIVAVLVPPGAAMGQSSAERASAYLYEGSMADGLAELAPLSEQGDSTAAFGVGVLTFFEGIEALAQPLYRHGFNPEGGLGSSPFLGVVRGEEDDGPAPEPLDYEMLRGYLETFVVKMDAAKEALMLASAGDAFAVEIDVLQIRADIDGDGVADDTETLGAFLVQSAAMAPDIGVSPEVIEPPASAFAFDNSDAIWLAGYSQVLATQADFLLAHDFETFFDAIMHRFFPGAGLPMERHASDGTLFLDRDSDALIADLVAAIHTINWPVEDRDRFSRVQERLVDVISLSRRNWDTILGETDDHLEFIPAPGQTPLHDGMAINKEMVAAWLETLDVTEQIVSGDLLLPHWRYSRLGFDLDAYFSEAERTDLVMLLTGLDALPYLKEGQIADADSFAAANRVFGNSIWNYALWFN